MKDKIITLDINGREYKVSVHQFSANEATVSVDGKEYVVGLSDLGAPKIPDVKPTPESVHRPAVIHAPKAAAPKVIHKPKEAGDASHIYSPLPGQVLKVLVKEGEEVCQGQTVCLLESMKMENEVHATTGGIIVDIKHQEGASVNQGDVLFLLKPVGN
ncbi:acetyl-CoA carboxylase biotin carboxyl carrier protein subunit [bacterium]|nr:acetyl-CoA carboxylase biotin carboxyl carrier protein subunit [bacterium]